MREAAEKIWGALVSAAFREVPNYSRWGLYPQGLLIIGCIFCMQWWPLFPGVAIGLLALVAVVMAVRADGFTRTEKVVWIAMSLVLCFVEIKTIYRDRTEYTKEQSKLQAEEEEARRKEREAFAALLEEGRGLFTQGKSVLDLSKKNLDAITGGDSFCYIYMSLERNGVPLYLNHYGRNHLFEVYVRVVDLDGFDRAVKAGRLFEDQNQYQSQFGPIPSLQRGTAKPLATYPPLATDADYKRYNVFIMARNGIFTELIRLRRRPENHLWAEAVLVSASYYDGRRGVVFKQVRDFPIETLSQDRDWTNAEKVPELRIKN